MDRVSGRLSVYYEEPFWAGVFERISDGKLSVCRAIFGAEPKDYEIWDFVLKNYCGLKFSPAVETEIKQRADNPKRRQRNAKKQLQSSGICTKSQQALQMQREERKTEHRKISKERQESEKLRRLELRQQKRREKHRGH